MTQAPSPASAGSSRLLFGSLRSYKKAWLGRDAVAGLTVWAVLVPEALAYASIAGVSPVVGLYAAPGALILYAAFGSSRHLVTGPMAATAALSAVAAADLATGGSHNVAAFTIAIAMMTGVLALAAGIFRLGFLANFISEPVMKGFIIGLAMTIIVGQVPKLLGISKGEGDFFEQAAHIITHLGDTEWQTLVVGLLSLIVVLGLRRWAPMVPGSLVAVLGGIIAVATLHLNQHGVEIVGHIDSGLPSLGLPSGLGLHDYMATAGASIGIMLVGFAEGLGAAKTYAARDHYEIDPNRELIGLGAANLGSGLCSGMVVNGSLSKTAVNASAGARSQMSGLIVAAMTVVTLLFLTGLFEDLPEATLAAVVIAALIELVDVQSLVELYRMSSPQVAAIYGKAARADFIAAMAALLGVLIFDTLPGLFIGIVVSLLLLVYRTSRPHIAELGRAGPGAPFTDLLRHPANQLVAGVVVLRPEAGLFFANADAVRLATIAAAARPGIRAVVIDAQSMPFVDTTALAMLTGLATQLQHTGVRFALARDIGQVRDLINRAEEPEDIRIELYATVPIAIEALSAASTTDETATPDES